MSLLGPNLEAFLTITRTKTVQAASKELGITQTGVTQRIRALEAQLDTTLFLRSRRGMGLTPEGEALLRYCQSARDLEGEALARIQSSGTRFEARVQLQGPTSIMRTRVIPQCMGVLTRYPELLVTFKISDHESGSEALRSGSAQFALLPPEEVAREMDSKLLKAEEYVLVGAPQWKRRELKEIIQKERIIDFDPEDQTSFSYLKKFKLHSHAKSQRHYVNNNESLVEMFHSGIGYGVLTREFAEPHLKSGRVSLLNSGAVFENRLALAWYPRPRPAEYFQALVDSIH
jgi:LysR family transcriptional regulator (chromosome initiation inhibitor)